MVTKDNFTEFIDKLQSVEKYVEDLNNQFKICLYDTEIFEYISWSFMQYLNSNFNEDAVDVIYWWLYEYEDRSEPGMWDSEGNVILMETIDDLWNYIKNEQL